MTGRPGVGAGPVDTPASHALSARWTVGVVVPARDEEATIEPCVASIRAALSAAGCPGRVVVVADRCADATAEVARRAVGDDGEVVLSSAGQAGAARRLGATRLLRWCPAPAERLWLATTDADGTVPPDWLRTHLVHARAGAAAVAGIVVLGEEEDEALAARHRAGYALRPDGTHPHVHGANLGVRGDAYLDVGGWSDALDVGEDHQLWTRLRERDWPVIATTTSWVTTSGRCESRVDGGFATDLRTLSSVAAPPSGRALEIVG